jgi:hypothetical protein
MCRTDVEVSAACSGTSGREIGDDDGGQHGAPARLHHHHAQDLALGLRHHHLLLQLLLREHLQLVAEDLLAVQHLLVVHLLHEAVVLDAVGFQKLHVSHLERLPDGLRYELCLKYRLIG